MPKGVDCDVNIIGHGSHGGKRLRIPVHNPDVLLGQGCGGNVYTSEMYLSVLWGKKILI